MSTKTKSLYSTAAIRELEQLAVSNYGVSVATLMQRAGSAVFRELKKHWVNAKKIIVVCGKGNNAGDGYVAARLAHEAGLKVLILTLAAPDKLTGTAREMAQLCVNAKIAIEPFTALKLQGADVIVDALLGIGLTGEVRDNYKTAIDAINSVSIPVLAVDIPSGLNADTGEILGSAVVATVTVTFIALKQGLFTCDTVDCCGEIIVDDLELPPEIFKDIMPAAKCLDLADLKRSLPKRKRNTHKGDYGHVLIIGGDYGMSGAVRMAAEAALRVGAGIVSVATRPEHAFTLNLTRPEIMCHGIKKPVQLNKLLAAARVIVLGPGLGQSNWAKSLWRKVIATNKPLVIDADGLNLLAQKKLKKNNWILTPHPKEAARLLGIDVSTVQKDRFAALKLLAEQYRGVVVLKGAGTLVRGSDDIVGVCIAGNPGMASGGMGDVLSGVIAGLLAQGGASLIAAELGVCLHAHAGDLAAKDQGERGLLAMDLLPYLIKLANNL